MDIETFLDEVTGGHPRGMLATSWQICTPNPDDPFEEIDLIFHDAAGCQVHVRLRGGIIRPSTHGPDPEPVSSLASVEFAEDVAAVVGCRLTLWSRERAR